MMSALRKLGIPALAGLLLAVGSWAQGAGPAPGVPGPVKEIQQGIGKAVTAVVRQDPAVAERIEDLNGLAHGDRRALLLQVALYLSRAAGTEESMGGAIVLHRLEFTPAEKLEAVLPHLEEAGPALRRVLGDVLATIDRPEGGEPDFAFYEARLRRSGRMRPDALIRYMYEVSPAVATESMSRVYGAGGAEAGRSAARARDLGALLEAHEAAAAWSDADLGKARRLLDGLARDPAWWMRLYAAEVLKANPGLASPETTGRLQADADPIVREAAGR